MSYTIRLGEIAHILGCGHAVVRTAIRHPTFPRAEHALEWDHDKVAAWAEIPRCTYGAGDRTCWNPISPHDTYGLHMCPKHTRIAEHIIDQQRHERATA